VQFTNNLSTVYDPEVGSGGFIWTGGDCHIYRNTCQIFFLTTPIHAFLRRGMPKEGTTLQHDYANARNVASNVQYLEYLTKLIDANLKGEENLHFTVTTLTYKTLVVTGMGKVPRGRSRWCSRDLRADGNLRKAKATAPTMCPSAVALECGYQSADLGSVDNTLNSGCSRKQLGVQLYVCIDPESAHLASSADRPPSLRRSRFPCREERQPNTANCIRANVFSRP
jgi:hypothetical protein